jgi:hypothetical protein
MPVHQFNALKLHTFLHPLVSPLSKRKTGGYLSHYPQPQYRQHCPCSFHLRLFKAVSIKAFSRQPASHVFAMQNGTDIS